MKIEIGYVMLIQKRKKKKGIKQTNRSYVHDSKNQILYNNKVRGAKMF